MKAPGKSYRTGISIFELTEMFPTEQSAVEWFEAILWPNGRKCGHCNGDKTCMASHKTMPYWCKECRKYFSVRTGTVLAKSNLPLRKWVFGVYLYVTGLKGISSMKLHRELHIGQKAAWYMLHRLRQAWSVAGLDKFIGPVEVDETYMGGLEKNKHEDKKLKSGRGGVGKTPIVGMKDRETNEVKAMVVPNTKKETLQGYVKENIEPGTETFTDDHRSYQGLENHETVCHSAGEYVKGRIHTNGIESFWAMFKRAHKGTYHKMSPKHLQRYVNEFVGRHGVRPCDTITQMQTLVKRTTGKKLAYEQLIAHNGLSSGARC